MTTYLDTSSLVKLYVSEPGSEDIRRLVGEASIVATSVVAYAEARAALARRAREGSVSSRGLRKARVALERDWGRYLALDATAELCQAAGDLAERYALRGFDSVHLASFLEVARSAGPSNVQFSSYDDRLNEAARRAVRALKRKGPAR